MLLLDIKKLYYGEAKSRFIFLIVLNDNFVDLQFTNAIRLKVPIVNY